MTSTRWNKPEKGAGEAGSSLTHAGFRVSVLLDLKGPRLYRGAGVSLLWHVVTRTGPWGAVSRMGRGTGSEGTSKCKEVLKE